MGHTIRTPDGDFTPEEMERSLIADFKNNIELGCPVYDMAEEDWFREYDWVPSEEYLEIKKAIWDNPEVKCKGCKQLPASGKGTCGIGYRTRAQAWACEYWEA